MDDSVLKLVIVFGIIFVSMSIHEMMHALTSYWLGDDTAKLQGRISINPLRHIDPFLTLGLPLLLLLSGSNMLFGAAKPVQVDFRRLKYDEFGGAIVGIVGPLTNLVLAILCAIALQSIHPTSTAVLYLLGYGVIVNVGFFVFNSIPWPPLDGSRLLYAFAPRPLQEFMERIEGMGITGLLLFMVFFYVAGYPILASLISKLSNALTHGLIGL